MHITGERRVPAPRERVWRSLSDPQVLQGCLQGSTIEPYLDPGDSKSDGGKPGEAAMLVRGIGAAPLHVQPSIRKPFETMGWKLDPRGPATQMVLIRLTEEGVFTRLHYELTLADETNETTLRARIDQALERLIRIVAGPAEIGAGGIATAVQAATEPSDQPNARIAAPAIGSGLALGSLLNPSVIGGALFLVVLLFMVGLF